MEVFMACVYKSLNRALPSWRPRSVIGARTTSPGSDGPRPDLWVQRDQVAQAATPLPAGVRASDGPHLRLGLRRERDARGLHEGPGGGPVRLPRRRVVPEGPTALLTDVARPLGRADVGHRLGPAAPVPVLLRVRHGRRFHPRRVLGAVVLPLLLDLAQTN